MKHTVLTLVLITLPAGICAQSKDIIRTFYNDADKKVRLTIWYKRYTDIMNELSTQDCMHKIVTYLKPSESKQIVIPTKEYENIALHTVMVSNTKRRSHWAALPYKLLKNAETFTILYDKNNCFRINSSIRR